MNVLELLRQDGLTPRKASGNKGGEYHSPCPGCGGEDRFHCWPEQNGGEGSWWCRICDTGGDLIQYLIDYRGMDFKEAATLCGREVGGSSQQSRRVLRAPRAENRRPSFSPRVCEAPADVWRRKAGEFVKWAHHRLMQSPSELEYLAGRGIGIEAVKTFRLGINPGERGRDLYRARLAWGLPRETKANGREKRLWLPRGIVIPFFRDGELHRVRIRRPEPREFGPKYYVVPGSGMAPMVINPEARAFVVVEAELDAILCAQNAPEGVGALGMGSLGARPDEVTDAILRRSLCILNALDFEHVTPQGEDEKSRALAERKELQQARQRDWWQATYDKAERWPVPEGKDPGEAFENGVDLALWIASGLPPVLTVGTSLDGKFREGGAAEVKQSTDVAPAADSAASAVSATVSPAPALASTTIPPQVMELSSLLTGTTVAYEKLPAGGWSIHYDSGWAMRHWDRFCEISESLWTPEVADWLDMHPNSLVGAENLLDHYKN